MRNCVGFVLLVASYAAAAQNRGVEPRLLQADELETSVTQAALQRQYDALLGMSLEMLRYDPRGPVERVVGETGIVLPHDTADRKKDDDASDLLPLLKDILLAIGTETLTVRDQLIVHGPVRSLRLSQSIHGIPVANATVALEYDLHTKRVSIIAARFVPDRGLPTEPTLSAQAAEDVVRRIVESDGGAKLTITGTYLAYYVEYGDPSPPQLVWVIATGSGYDEAEKFYVSAETGLVVARQKLSMEVTRKVYDINNSTLPGFPNDLPLPLNIDQINAQQYRKDGYEHVELVDSTLRLKIPESIGQLPSKVHIFVRYSSPGYADGTSVGSEYFLRFGGTNATYQHATRPRDVVAHEFGHGLGFRTFPMLGDPSDQQHHALQEAFADITATVVDVAINQVPNTLTWIIGDQFFKSDDFHGLRSFSNPLGDSRAEYPSTDWFPARIFWHAIPHYNSTIISHAYYLLVNGGMHVRYIDPEIPDTNITAQGELKTRKIFYAAFRSSLLDVDTTMPTLKDAAISYANSQYGAATRTQVKNAFEAVGICRLNNAPPASYPTTTIVDHFCAGQFDISWLPVPGANRYYAEVTEPSLGWAFSQPVTDINGTECSLVLPSRKYYRIRACNDCGCGPWSPNKVLQFWDPCL